MKTLTVIVAGLLILCTAASAETRYRVIDLGALIDPSGLAVPSRASGIDQTGRVVGTGAPQTPGNGFRYADGKIQTLTLGYPHTVPSKMSDNGRAAGDALKHSSSVREAFRFDGGPLIALGTNGNGFGRGTDVNNKGVIVGYTAPNSSSAATFITRWDKSGAPHSVPTIGGGFGRTFGINNKDWIVGDSDTGVPFEGRHAVLSVDGQTSDLGVLRSGGGSVAYGVSDSGIVVGSSLISVYRDAGIHAFRWKSGRMRDLGTLGGLDSAAMDVNTAGTIVGYSLVKVPGSTVQQSHGFVYQDGQMRDLNDLLIPGEATYLIYSASAINAAGQIAASGVVLLPNGSTYDKALLLTPANDFR